MKKNIFNKLVLSSTFVPLAKVGVLALTSAFSLTSCSSEDSLSTSTSSSALTFNVETPGVQSKATTNYSTKATSFQENDKVGVFGILNGSIVPQYNNIKLVRNNLGRWTPEQDLTFSDDMQGIQFYGYYPYDPAATLDLTQTDPFKTYKDNFVMQTDQRTNEKYEASDLMTTGACGVSSSKSVTLSMSHAMVMLNIQIPNQSITFSNEGMSPYVVKSSTWGGCTLDDESIIYPHFDETTQSYFYLVKPGFTNDIIVSYNDGSAKTYTISNISSLLAGTYKEVKIDGGAQQTAYGTLAVGDFYMKDGTLQHKGTTVTASDVAGVVCYVGTYSYDEYPKAVHARVLAVAAPVSSKMGSVRPATTAWATACSNAGLKAYSGAAGTTEPTNSKNGLTITNQWLAAEAEVAGDATSCAFDLGASAYNTFVAANTLPTGLTTPWYIPSIGEWTLLANLVSEDATAFDKSLSDAGGAALWTPVSTNSYYWAVEPNAVSSPKVYAYNKNFVTKGTSRPYNVVANTSAAYFRYMFQF